jgi:hypothetical protein
MAVTCYPPVSYHYILRKYTGDKTLEYEVILLYSGRLHDFLSTNTDFTNFLLDIVFNELWNELA